MLVGTYEHKLDSKGRVVLPARFRQELSSGVVCTIGIDKCISLYSMDKWERVLEKLQQLPFSKGRSRDLMRLMLSSASELQIDNAGRILVPPFLRSHAGLEQDISLIGVNDHIELWNSENWNSYISKIVDVLPEIAEDVEGF
ncbi:MAG: division/cell wall cluster transcriptional repressor MraZ [Synergistales bacterium]|nr:division/cell wall cluster transcriptional repressor MraZ [Synergistales bacterium]